MRKSGRWKTLALPVAGVALLAGLAFGFGGFGQNAATPAGPAGPAGPRARLRLAYFPNLTHAPALVGVGQGRFQQELGRSAGVDTRVFNAGPEEMEALLAGEVDLGYVGPSPALNTYVKSGGRALRILAGACSGGASLVARADTNITGIRDLDGRRVADPQLGGTQDVSLRHFLAANGLRPKEKGGSVQILPVKNPDVLPLFLKKEIDAAWVPEPWATRLIEEAGARRVIDERDLWRERRFATTVVVARAAFLRDHRPEVQAVLRAHLRAVDWLRQHPSEAQVVANQELKRLTGKALPDAVLREAWGRLDFTPDPNRASIEAFVQAAQDAGYLQERSVDLAALFDLDPLRDAGFHLASTGR